MAHPAAEAYARAAETITEAVREHKRAASYHRRETARLMARLDEVRRECERLGIDLQITEAGRRPE